VSEQKLTVDQVVRIDIFKERIKALSTEGLRDLLVQLYKDAIVQETNYKQKIKKAWGLENGDD